MNKQMKKLIMSVLVLIVLITMAGCGKSSGIVGKWKDDSDTVVFSSNGRFSSHYYWMGGSYSVNGDKLTLSPSMLDDEEYTYEIDNSGDLIIKENGKESYHFTKVK